MISERKQRGTTLIELMISMALSMTLMAAALQFIVSTRQTYELNDDISRIQENGRLALDILVRNLQMAGYRNPRNGNGKIPDFFLRQCNNTAENEDTEADNNADDACFNEGGTSISDRIAVQYDPPPDDGTETDCLGISRIGATDIIANVFFIDDKNGDGINSLYCQSYNSTTETWIGSGPQPLVDGIDAMQVLFGVANNNDDRFSVSKYISGDKLAVADWPNLRAVRIALLVGNGSSAGFAENRPRHYRLLDSDPFTITDGQARRIYSTTVKFNNYRQL